MNKFRVGLGILISLFLSICAIYLIACMIFEKWLPFMSVIWAVGILFGGGLIIYGIVELLKWCFKPLEK